MSPSAPAKTPADIEPLAKRIERRRGAERLRLLIVGAGLAGATLAALLRQRGDMPIVIEKGVEGTQSGYMLGLLPLGGRVLNGLGLAKSYAKLSLPMHIYDLYGRTGERIRRYPLDRLVTRFGTWGGVARGPLLHLLRTAAGPIYYETTLAAITDHADHVTATFGDGSKADFDLIVGADGIHSATRDLILSPHQVETFDTGWGGHMVWSDLAGQQKDAYAELWSAGWGVGLYPVADRLGLFLAGRHEKMADIPAQTYAETLAKRLPDGPFRSALDRLDRSQCGFYWKMEDRRAQVWSRGRTVLLGDAAAAFLPTAGVGASAAMDSAAALADELGRADAAHMDFALALYERRQRSRVERAQKNSRSLARYMFVKSAPMAWARDQFMRFYTLDSLVKDIENVMTGR